MSAEKKQAEYFKEISKLFYDHNFGQSTKSEIELLMFHFFMENMRSEGIIPSDYKIGLELGISAQKVRNLRIKEKLAYCLEIDWKKELCALMSNARYEDPYMVVDMPDPNVLMEIKNHLEEEGKFVITQRNPRLLTMRVEYFLDLAIEVDDKGRDEIYKELKSTIRENNKGEEIDLHPVKNSIKEIMGVVGDITTIAANLISIVSPTNTIATAALSLIMPFS